MAPSRHTCLSALWVKQWKPASKLSICEKPCGWIFFCLYKIPSSEWSILEISSMHKLKEKHTHKKNKYHPPEKLLAHSAAKLPAVVYYGRRKNHTQDHSTGEVQQAKSSPDVHQLFLCRFNRMRRTTYKLF